jgi:hypothetical protein
MNKLSFTFKYSVRPGARKEPKNVKSELPKYPLIPVRFYNPKDKSIETPIFEALLDSGSDGVHLHRDISDSLGLTRLKKTESEGMGGKYNCFETEVGLILGRGGRTVDFGVVEAVFPEQDLNVPLLIGRKPVFEEFQIIFEEFKDKFKLIPKEDVI